MALHLKSNKSFIIILTASAVLISTMAAIFSVTGMANLFSGYFTTVAMMMGSLEFSKIVVASFLARYWNTINRALKTYFIIALVVLITITSGGIFGYLSDAYQKTKGDYSIIEKDIQLIDTKVKLFQSEKERYQNRVDVLIKAKTGQESRLDSLYSRGQISIAKRVESQIESSNREVSELSLKLNAINDSISYYETKKVEKETKNISGELGPLKYLSVVFNTDMDTVVKYIIFLLIFVFDPLAILLFVSINTLLRKEIDIKENNNNNDYDDSNIENINIKTDSSSILSYNENKPDYNNSTDNNTNSVNDVNNDNYTEKNNNTSEILNEKNNDENTENINNKNDVEVDENNLEKNDDSISKIKDSKKNDKQIIFRSSNYH